MITQTLIPNYLLPSLNLMSLVRIIVDISPPRRSFSSEIVPVDLRERIGDLDQRYENSTEAMCAWAWNTQPIIFDIVI